MLGEAQARLSETGIYYPQDEQLADTACLIFASFGVKQPTAMMRSKTWYRRRALTTTAWNAALPTISPVEHDVLALNKVANITESVAIK